MENVDDRPRSIDKKIIIDDEGIFVNEVTGGVLKSVRRDIISQYSGIKMTSPVPKNYNNWDEKLNEYFEKNNQEIIARNLIMYNEEMAGVISIVTRRTFDNHRGIEQKNYYFYNLTSHEDKGGLNRVPIRDTVSIFGGMLEPFNKLGNSTYLAESLLMHITCELQNLPGNRYLVDPFGRTLIQPCFPMDVSVELNEIINARFPMNRTGIIYNTKTRRSEKTHIL